MIRRWLAAALAGLVLWPALAAAQLERAGFVTTLEGNVVARHGAVPERPLKFKDEVFLQDTVSTGEKSLARMLLGGKAVVTVRERSVLTITEVPGRSTIDLASGKFALAVARDRMRSGEEIQIRTPNAVAGVRGTVVIVEVTPPSVGRSTITNFYVLRGTITAQPIDPSTRLPASGAFPVREMEAYSQVGNSPGVVSVVTADRIGAIVEGLSPSGS